MKKNDFVIFFLAFLAILVLFLAYFLQPRKGDTVIIRQNGQIYQRVDLDTDTVIDVNGKNTVVIQNGQVYMQDADCPDKLCIRQGKISDGRKEIICLPNQVTVSVTKKSEFDSVTR